ncbi:MAG: hypothetical protein QXT43_02570 [Candidatus Micrarchaeaceae archaeon]
MRSQSSIEFLTTYGFMFIIIGVVISVLAFITFSPLVYSPSQCNSYAGLYCSAVQLYSNSTGHFSIVTLSLTNSGSVPVNLSNITVTVRGLSATGTCTPSIALPGQGIICLAQFASFSPAFASYVQGFYKVSADICNSGISSVYNGTCAYQSANFSGSFEAPAEPSLAVPVSVLALQGSRSQQLAPYTGLPYLPNTSVVQSTYLLLNLSKKALQYAFGTPSYQGDIYLGQKVVPFPFAVNSLNNNNVDCSTPGRFNSTYSIFATTLFLPSVEVLNVSYAVDDRIIVLYKPSTSSSWSPVPNAGWQGSSTGNIVHVGPGLYNLEIMWVNVCAPGVQVVKISNFTSSI